MLMMRGSGAKCSHLRHDCVHDTTNTLDEKVLCEMNFRTRDRRRSRERRVSRSSFVLGSLPSEPVTDRQGEHGLGVLDPSVIDHGEGLLPGHDHGLEPLIELKVLRTRLEVFAQE
jgi:hypothetical protein